jgi:hypothetical protein
LRHFFGIFMYYTKTMSELQTLYLSLSLSLSLGPNQETFPEIETAIKIRGGSAGYSNTSKRANRKTNLKARLYLAVTQLKEIETERERERERRLNESIQFRFLTLKVVCLENSLLSYKQIN